MSENLDVQALIKFMFSTVLGYGVVAGAVILKVPQILKIVRANSAKGVSLPSNLLEITGYAISTSWALARGLQFKDFGENVFVMVQLVVLILLIAFHQKNITTALTLLTAILSSFYALSVGMVDEKIHQSLLGFQILLSISSRVPQIYMNYRDRSTGQLAFLTYFLAFGGGAARLITTTLNVPWEKGKATILAQFGTAVFLNGLILSQIWIYREASKKQK